MKKILFLISIPIIFVSCNKDNGIKVNTAEVKNNIQSGTWKISYFEDDGQDETYHFEGYSFTFNENGTISSTNGTNTYTGTWSIDDDSNDDSSSKDDDDFIINFNVSDENEFEELNDDWDFVSQSATKIELKDISGGDGSVDKLTFIKQ